MSTAAGAKPRRRLRGEVWPRVAKRKGATSDSPHSCCELRANSSNPLLRERGRTLSAVAEEEGDMTDAAFVTPLLRSILSDFFYPKLSLCSLCTPS